MNPEALKKFQYAAEALERAMYDIEPISIALHQLGSDRGGTKVQRAIRQMGVARELILSGIELESAHSVKVAREATANMVNASLATLRKQP